MRGITLVFGMLVIMSLACCQPVDEELTIDFRDKTEESYLRLPYCRRYKFSESDYYSERYLFTCLQCEDGFAPVAKGVDNVELNGVVDSFPAEEITVCQRDPFFEKPMYCSHPHCQKELPQCIQYSLDNYDTFEIFDKTTQADFTCLECAEDFEPLAGGMSRDQIDQSVTKQLCTRKTGTFECGIYCQLEFPGCKKVRISKVSRREERETANFECLEGEGQYMPIHVDYRDPTAKEHMKELTILSDSMGTVKCEDLYCQHVFPNCEEYYFIDSGMDYKTYYCKKCAEGFVAKSKGFTGYVPILMYANKLHGNLCEMQPSVGPRTCDLHCQETLPGCLTYSAKKAEVIQGLDLATYKCHKCEEGYEIVEDDSPAPVHSAWNLKDNIKVRCRPKITETPVECDEQCKEFFPHCNRYQIKKDASLSLDVFEYLCLACDEGFEAIENAEIKEWYSSKHKHVCKPKVTTGPVPCDSKCQKAFPQCLSIEVQRNELNHSTYRCHQLQEGYYPISYQDPSPGVLSVKWGPMYRYNTVYLGSQNQFEIYHSKEECIKDHVSLDAENCWVHKNCKTLALAQDLRSGEQYLKCLQCFNGFKLKKERNRRYAADQSLCEPIANLFSAAI